MARRGEKRYYACRGELVEGETAIADCLDCVWTYLPSKGARYPGRDALVRGRVHAKGHHHEVVVHRSTSYGPKPT